MTNFDNFTKKYVNSKTIRLEAIPVGKTLKNIEKMGFIAADRQRDEDYQKAKSVIDHIYKAFMDDCLKDLFLDWDPLYEAVVACWRERSPEGRQALQIMQADYRKKIADRFRNHELYGSLFTKKIFDGSVAQRLPDLEQSAEEKSLLSNFNKFTSYFRDFFDKRKRLFSDDEKHSAIAYRLINENFLKFVANCEAFRRMTERVPELREKLQNTGSLQVYNGLALDEVFSADFYNQLIVQKQIDLYNQLIGGIAGEPGTPNIQGLNATINLALQGDSSLHEKLAGIPHRFNPLYKQILSDVSTLSFVPSAFQSDGEMLAAVRGFKVQLESGRVLQNVRRLFNGLETEADLSRVYVNNSKLAAFSSMFFGRWNLCSDALFAWKKGKQKKITNKKLTEIKKWLKNSDIAIAEIQEAFGEDFPRGKINEKIQAQADALHSQLALPIPENLKALCAKDGLKSMLDTVLGLYRMLQWFIVGDDNEKDSDFYFGLGKILGSLDPVLVLYNRVRNYITKKPYSLTKFRLNFDNSQLLNGWDENNLDTNCASIFIKDGKYYLGISNKNNRPQFDTVATSGKSGYQRMVYKQFANWGRDLPHSTTQMKKVKKHFSASDADYVLDGDKFIRPLIITKEIFDLNNVKFNGKKKLQVDYLRNTGDREGYTHALHTWINFAKDFCACYKSTSIYDISCLRPTDQYDNLMDFYADLGNLSHRIVWQTIPEEAIDNYVEQGQLFLFQLYNKDFAPGADGKPNLHTLYWKAVFNPENLEDVVVKLNGKAELFYRPRSNMDVVRHKVGEKLVNRKLKNGLTLPSRLHEEIYRYVNGTLNKDLSADARSVLPLAVVRDVQHEIIKDRRFTADKFFFHASLTFNFKSSDKPVGFNEDVREYLREHPDTYVVGVDRGERNLIYIVVIDPQGNIVEQRSFNMINGIDYWSLLDQKEKERVEAKQAWETVGKIKDLKCGYLSFLIHEITKIIIKYHAVVILENLSLGFKRVRTGIAEKAVYQQFERMLVTKLGYVVFKDRAGKAPGGVLNAYQLTDNTRTAENTGIQNGFLFYVPAAFTSRVDPATGFFDFYDWGKIKTATDKKNFIAGFNSVRYERSTGDFIVHVGAKNLAVRRVAEDVRTEWDIVIEANVRKMGIDGNSYISGKRIRYRSGEQGHGQYENHLPCQELIRALQQYGIQYETGKDILPAILQQDDAKLTDTVFDVFRLALQMRNTSAETGEDYFNSVVRDRSGRCFDTRRAEAAMPKEADANDAYHIALKGLFVLEKLRKGESIGIKNTEWLRYVQQRHS